MTFFHTHTHARTHARTRAHTHTHMHARTRHILCIIMYIFYVIACLSVLSLYLYMYVFLTVVYNIVLPQLHFHCQRIVSERPIEQKHFEFRLECYYDIRLPVYKYQNIKTCMYTPTYKQIPTLKLGVHILIS